MHERERILTMIGDRIAAARQKRNEAPPDSSERHDADEELIRLEETLRQFMSLGRLPAAFEEGER